MKTIFFLAHPPLSTKPVYLYLHDKATAYANGLLLPFHAVAMVMVDCAITIYFMGAPLRDDGVEWHTHV